MLLQDAGSGNSVELGVVGYEFPAMEPSGPGFEARNHIAHGVWFSYEELDVAVRLRRSGKHERMSFTANELMNLAINIKRLELECVAMFYEVTGIEPGAATSG